MVETIAAINNPKITRGKKGVFTDEERKKHCKEYRDSGLSIKKYCELNKISQSALGTWIGKFKTKSFFTPISPKPLINPANKQSFEVIFPTGMRLRFPELIDLSVITQLIKGVEGCS